MIDQLKRDTRGQAIGIGNFFLALLVGAVMSWIIHAITTPLLDTARDHGTDPIATQSTAWITEFVTNLPVLWLFTSLFALLALSIFQRQIT